MTNAMLVTETLTKMTCGKCAGCYAISERFRQECHDDAIGLGWNCPYCKCWWGYPGKTEAEKQRERADQAEARERNLKCRAATLERSRNALKGVVTKTKRRIGKGVCPCCNRTFQDLQRHMAGKHPEYADV